MSVGTRPDHRVRKLLEQFGIEEDAALVPLADLRKEIYQYGKRRCDVEASRDNLKYHLGAAFEGNSALDLDSLALTGLLSMPWRSFLVLGCKEIEGQISLTDALRKALDRPDVRDWCIEQGIWLQWQRLQAIYQAEIEEFRASDAYRRAGWRRKSITKPQHYLIGEICRVTSTEVPALTNRGQAYDFIAAEGGNPRFWTAPEQPPEWRA